ncbi:MAG: hypothetical protein E2P02_27305 [Acidobacteria bacterium]|nr:MAG: hypothetical protein E2P02_27305 [Acidobacteriota bacterium]
MSTIIDKLLNRDTEAKPSAQELRQIATLAHAESERLAALVNQARSELEQEAGIQASLVEVEARVTTADGSLRAFEQRVSASQELSEATGELEGRIRTLDQIVTTADARIRQVEARNGKLNEARANIEKLISSGIEAEAKLASFKNHAQETAGIQGDIQRIKGGLDELDGQFGLIRDDYDRLKDVVSSVRQESTNIDDKARFVTAQLERAEAATRQVEEVVKSLTNSHSLSKQTHEQLRQLNALAQHVNQKLRSLGATKELVDRANAQMNEVNEVVWDVDRKVKKLNDQSQWLKEIEGSVERFQDLRQQFAQDVEGAEQQTEKFAADGERVRTEITHALSQIQQRLESAALLKEEVEVANKRAMEVYESIAKLEDHLGALASKDDQIKETIGRADELTARLEAQKRDVDNIENKLQLLRSFEERLEGMKVLADKVSSQADAIAASEPMVAETRQQIQEFGEARVAIQRDLESLNQSCQEVKHAGRLLNDFRQASLSAEAAIREMAPRLQAVDVLQARLANLDQLSEKLDVRMAELEPRAEFVSSVESRLNRLGELSRAVDERLEGQLARQSELEAMRNSQDGLSSEVEDLKKLVSSLREDESLPRMEQRTIELESRIETSHEKLQAFELTEKAMQERARRAQELGYRLDGMTDTLEQNSERVSVVTQELENLNEGRREWLHEVHRIGEEQKSLSTQSNATIEQLDKIRVLTDALDDKQRQLSESERRIEHYEDRLDTLEGLLGNVNGKIDEIEQRQESVDQVRQQVDSLFEATEKTRNDAMEVLEARQDILETKKTLELLLREASVLGSKYNHLEERRGAIDQAEAKMDHLTTVIVDIEANLENLKEQRTVIEHVAEKLARLDFALQRAEAATRELREERALAARIYKNIQQKDPKVPGKPGTSETKAAPTPQNGS